MNPGAPAPSSEAQRKPAVAGDHRRDLLLFQLYRFLSTSYLFAPVLVLFFSGRGLDYTEITLLNSVYAVTAVLFEVPTGVLADRWGRRRAMVLGSLMMAGGCALDFLGHSFAVFAAGEGLLALGMTLTSGADSAWLYDLLRDAGREQDYQRYEGGATSAKLIGAALALAIGGRLASHDVASTYLASLGVCLLAAFVALGLREAPVSRPSVPPAIYRQMVDSARTVWSHGPLRFAVLFSTLVFTLVRMAIYLHQPYLSAAGMDLSDVGDVLAVLSIGAAFGAARIEDLRRHLGERALVIGLPLVLGTSYVLLAERPSVLGVGLLAAQALCNGVYSPLSKELLNREIRDSSHRATILSVESMVRRLAFGAFAPVAGLLIDQRGLGAGCYACAALGLLGSGWLVVYLYRLHRLHRIDGRDRLAAEADLDGSVPVDPSVAHAASRSGRIGLIEPEPKSGAVPHRVLESATTRRNARR